GAVVEIEIVDVGRTHVHAERLGDLAEWDVQTQGLFAVDGDHKLRVRGGIGSEQTHQIFARTPFADELLSGSVQVLKRMIALVLDFELETSERAQTLDGRRRHSDYQGS